MYLETNVNRNTLYQNLWDTTKIVLGKFKVISAYFKKEEQFQVKKYNFILQEIRKIH